jgi:hypothetical protein
MKPSLLVIALIALTTPALAGSYPVNGRFGVVTSFTDKPLDCAGKRTIAFNGDQRTDSNGGVPAYRNRSVTKSDNSYRVTDEFTTGQISNGHTDYTLRQTDADHLEMTQQGGSTLKLQRCK